MMVGDDLALYIFFVTSTIIVLRIDVSSVLQSVATEAWGP
jgi:hypothetical protein